MFDFMEPSNELEQASNLIGGIFENVQNSYSQDALQCVMENNSRLITDAQLHLSDQLLHQDFNRRY